MIVHCIVMSMSGLSNLGNFTICECPEFSSQHREILGVEVHKPQKCQGWTPLAYVYSEWGKEQGPELVNWKAWK